MTVSLVIMKVKLLSSVNKVMMVKDKVNCTFKRFDFSKLTLTLQVT